MSEVTNGTTAKAVTTSARDAALAALGDDFGKPDSGGDDGGSTEDVRVDAAGNAAVDPGGGTADRPGDDVAAPTPERVEAKPEPLSPQLAELARKEKHYREQSAALKAERESFAKQKAEWEASKGSIDALHAEVTSDIVAYADKRKLTNEQRRALADDLFWSTQPEEKRPPTFRQATKVRSELDIAKEQAAKVARELEEYKAQQAKKEQEAELKITQERVVGELVAELPDTARLTRAFLKANPQQARKDLWEITVHMAQQDPNRELTAEMVAAEYESLLKKQLAWAESARGEVAPQTSPRGIQASNPLTNERTASPAKAGVGPKTAEQRKAEALAALADD